MKHNPFLEIELAQIIMQEISKELENGESFLYASIGTENIFLKEELDDLNKHKVEFMESPYVEKGNCYIIDFEKMRKEIYMPKKRRGKMILYHPEDAKYIEEYKS